MKKSMITKDLYLGGFLVLLSVLCYIESLSYPYQSAYFPRFIIALLAMLGLATVVKEIIKHKKATDNKQAKASSTDEKVAFWMMTSVRKVSMMIFSSLVYMVVMNYVGFFVTTSVYLPIMMRLLGIRRLRTLFLSTFVVVFVIYMIFVAFLNVPFPEGIAI